MEFKSPEIHRTPLYRAKSAYCGMQARCLNKNGKSPTYANVELRMTLNEWLAWSLPEYEKFSIEHPEDSPNAARHGDAGHYEIGNISIVTDEYNRAERTARSESLAKEDGTKRCSKCKYVKTVDDFYNSARMLDGLQKNCKDCCRKMQTGGVIRIKQPVEIEHGTRSGYQVERRRGLVPCDACKEANRLEAKKYRLEHKV
jgi:hypothetical protein